MTLDYLKNRVQFGQVIGSFQALGHRAAGLYTEMEMARSCVEAALQAIDDGSAIDLPRRMLHPISKCPTRSVLAKAPLVFLEEVLDRVGVRHVSAVARRDPQRMGATELEVMLHRHATIGACCAARHRDREVRLVVERSGEAGDEALGDELADEDNPSRRAMANVEAQIDLRKVPIAGPGDAEDLGVEEVEGDEANKRLSVTRIERQAAR